MTNLIPTTILEQLGGHRFLAMTGSRDLMALAAGPGTRGGLQLKPGRNSGGVFAVRIELTDADTYRVRIFAGRSARTAAERSVHEDIYAEDLRALLERETGLRTAL